MTNTVFTGGVHGITKETVNNTHLMSDLIAAANLIQLNTKLNKEEHVMFADRIQEFKGMYEGIMSGEVDAVEVRKSMLAKLSSIELFGDMDDFICELEDSFTESQRLMYYLVRNRVMIGTNVYFTRLGNYGFFVDITKVNEDGTEGAIYTIDMNKFDVVITDKCVVITQFTTYRRVYPAIYPSGMGPVEFNVDAIPKGWVTRGYSYKGSKRYRSIVRKYDLLNETTINLKAHSIIFGMVHGYKVLLTLGTNKLFTINHIDERVQNNCIRNLELVTQRQNIMHSKNRRISEGNAVVRVS